MSADCCIHPSQEPGCVQQREGEELLCGLAQANCSFLESQAGGGSGAPGKGKVENKYWHKMIGNTFLFR